MAAPSTLAAALNYYGNSRLKRREFDGGEPPTLEGLGEQWQGVSDAIQAGPDNARKWLEKEPGYTYSAIVPAKHDASGKTSWALQDMVRNPLIGALDLMQMKMARDETGKPVGLTDPGIEAMATAMVPWGGRGIDRGVLRSGGGPVEKGIVPFPQPRTAEGLAAKLRDAFPDSEVRVNHSLPGGYGQSSYVEFSAAEPKLLFEKRKADWTAAGKGSGRGPEPIMPSRIAHEYRLSDHDLGDRRARQYTRLFGQDMTDADMLRLISDLREQTFLGKVAPPDPRIAEAMFGATSNIGKGIVPELTKALTPKPFVPRAEAALPMDEASRMARAKAMGFDVDAYHATTRDFPAFDNAQIGSNLDTGYYGTGHYSAPTPLNRRGEAEGPLTNYIAGNYDKDGPIYFKGANIIPLKLKMNNPLIIDKADIPNGKLTSRVEELTGFKSTFGWPLEESQRPEFMAAVKKAGYDGVRVDYDGKPIEYVSPDPTQIRSRFAAFDPAKADSADLLALALGTVGVGAAAAARPGAEQPYD